MDSSILFRVCANISQHSVNCQLTRLFGMSGVACEWKEGRIDCAVSLLHCFDRTWFNLKHHSSSLRLGNKIHYSIQTNSVLGTKYVSLIL